MTDTQVLEDIGKMSLEQWHTMEFPAGTYSDIIEGFAHRIVVKAGDFKLTVGAQVIGHQVSFQLLRRL